MLDIFKQHGFIRIASEGVSADIPLAPAIIVFGPNDAGKTNTLRAITSVLRGSRPAPRDPVHPEVRHQGDVAPDGGWDGVWVELELERPDHQELLLRVASRESQPDQIEVRLPPRFDSGSIGQWYSYDY